MRTISSRALWLLAAIALPAQAQNAGGGAGAGSGGMGGAPGLAITTPAPIQPATGSSRIGQAPANSAMRQGSGMGAGSAATGNPMGMAGMASSGTNALTLTGNGGMSGQGGSNQGSGQSSGASRGRQGSSVRITDTGVTQRMPAGSSAPR